MTVIELSVVVEGASDVGVAQAIVRECGSSVHRRYIGSGKSKILKKINGYNESARYQPWLVLVDLDADFACAPDARTTWLPAPANQMCFRIAVPEVEAWLLSDRMRVARFLGVAESLIPADPEKLPDPKAAFVQLACSSRRRDVREGLVPRVGSGASIGPTYASDVSDFAVNLWRPQVAAVSAPSLSRCLDRLRDMVERLGS